MKIADTAAATLARIALMTIVVASAPQARAGTGASDPTVSEPRADATTSDATAAARAAMTDDSKLSPDEERRIARTKARQAAMAATKGPTPTLGTTGDQSRTRIAGARGRAKEGGGNGARKDGGGNSDTEGVAKARSVRGARGRMALAATSARARAGIGRARMTEVARRATTRRGEAVADLTSTSEPGRDPRADALGASTGARIEGGVEGGATGNARPRLRKVIEYDGGRDGAWSYSSVTRCVGGGSVAPGCDGGTVAWSSISVGPRRRGPVE